MRVLDLFSGIGAFSLGLERAGMHTVAFCEIDPFCRRVLAKHWPEVPCYDDVRELSGQHLTAAGIAVDLICGGFPCQDISIAGKHAGIGGERSGLWREFARLIGEIQPRYAIVENVAALLGRGLGDVLGDLAALGYDAEWHCIPASAIGAPHIRDRIWIVAYADEERRTRFERSSGVWEADTVGGCSPHVADAASTRCGEGQPGSSGSLRNGTWRSQSERLGSALADADSRGWREQGDVSEAACDARSGQSSDSSEIRITSRTRLEIGPRTLREWAHAATTGAGWWAVEPDVGRVVDGPASRVDRRKRLIGLGNSLVPQIPELIGRAIMSAEGRPTK